MNQAERIRQLMNSSTSMFCVLLIFAIRVCITLWPAGSLMSRIWCAGSLALCILGIITNMQVTKKLTGVQ